MSILRIHLGQCEKLKLHIDPLSVQEISFKSVIIPPNTFQQNAGISHVSLYLHSRGKWKQLEDPSELLLSKSLDQGLELEMNVRVILKKSCKSRFELW